jgi:hypothetical protein
MTTKLVRFTQWARESPQRQNNALMGMLFDPDGLSASFERQAGRKAPGVDGIRKADYAEGLEDRLLDLSARLRRIGYRPKPAITSTQLRRGRLRLGAGWCNAPSPVLRGRRPVRATATLQIITFCQVSVNTLVKYGKAYSLWMSGTPDLDQ